MLEHGLRTPTGHIARQTRRIDEIRPRMTVVEEEVSWLRSQFAPGDRGERDGSQPPEAATEGARKTARASDSFPGHQVYSKRARLFAS